MSVDQVKLSDSGKVEPIVLLLFVAMVFFTGAVFAAEHWYPNDGQIFQVVSNLLSGVTGAFLMRVKPPGDSKSQPPQSINLTQNGGLNGDTRPTDSNGKQ